MLTIEERIEPTVLPVFDADDLGIPFKVKLIDSVSQIINPEDGDVLKTIIPNVPGLLCSVAMARILEPRKLSGPELKFVRKVFRVPAKKLAERIGVSPEHLSRCEASDRVLSVGAEKCLRISLFLDNFKLPKDIVTDECEDEKVKAFAQKYTSAVKRIEEILDDMKITSAHPVEDELILAFQTQRVTEDLFSDDPQASWHSNENVQKRFA